MNDPATRNKWNNFARLYKFATLGSERRWEPFKRDFFSHMGEGNILFLAVGIGNDIQFFPGGRTIVGIDISPEMLKRAQPKAQNYKGDLALKEMDARSLSFASGSFDQVFTSCTFCSVPDPVKGLKELYRVIRPGGELRMFEHTASRYFPFKQMLDLMNPVAEKIGPSVNRDTIANVQTAGFVIRKISNIYLDIVKTIEAVRPV